MYYISIISSDVVLRKCYDLNNNISFYDVYKTPCKEEDLVGDYIGEFTTNYEFDENEELFINDLEKWLHCFDF